jgi:hypothetical protein
MAPEYLTSSDKIINQRIQQKQKRLFINQSIILTHLSLGLWKLLYEDPPQL